MVIPVSQATSRKEGYRFHPISKTEEFFQQTYPEFLTARELSEQEDKEIQSQLFSSLRKEPTLYDSREGICLRCRISHEIFKACKINYRRYGNNPRKPFVLDSLLLLFLTDNGQPFPSNYLEQKYRKEFFHGIQVLHECIVKGKNSLGLAVNMILQSPIMEKFLLEHEIYPYSDWSILNNHSQGQLERVLQELYLLPVPDINRACLLLESYHFVYTEDRRRRGLYTPCVPPTDEQLERMIDYLWQTHQFKLDSKKLIKELKAIAKRLREAIIIRKGGNPDGVSLDVDDDERGFLHEKIPDPNTIYDSFEADRQEEWENLNEVLIESLDRAIQQKVAEGVKSFSSRIADLAPKFKEAIQLRVCQNLSQVLASRDLGIYQVRFTRYLEPRIKSLRQQCKVQVAEDLIKLIRGNDLVDAPQKLEEFEKLISLVETCLEENKVFLSDKDFLGDSRTSSQNTPSLFIERLCYHLNHSGCCTVNK